MAIHISTDKIQNICALKYNFSLFWEVNEHNIKSDKSVFFFSIFAKKVLGSVVLLP